MVYCSKLIATSCYTCLSLCLSPSSGTGAPIWCKRTWAAPCRGVWRASRSPWWPPAQPTNPTASNKWREHPGRRGWGFVFRCMWQNRYKMFIWERAGGRNVHSGCKASWEEAEKVQLLQQVKKPTENRQREESVGKASKEENITHSLLISVCCWTKWQARLKQVLPENPQKVQNVMQPLNETTKLRFFQQKNLWWHILRRNLCYVAIFHKKLLFRFTIVHTWAK